MEGREHSKSNSVPHQKAVMQILEKLKYKHARNAKQHESETANKNYSITKENQILLSKLVEIQDRKKSICALPEVNDRKNKTQTSWSTNSMRTPRAFGS
jgi:hypothetical protein